MSSELELLLDLHRGNPRQGPGSEAMTLRALALTGLDRDRPLRIADIGCGTGAQTLTLAAHTKAQSPLWTCCLIFCASWNRGRGRPVCTNV
jgi:hypothetical protein